MENNKLDIIVLGATGFTGKKTVKYLAKITKKTDCGYTWGISGRSKEKLKCLLLELEEAGEKIINIPVIECDITKDDISTVSSRAKVILNCTGPNTLLCQPIVKACIDTKTDYIDISAELYAMIDLYRTFHKSAEEANVVIIPACGFAALPVAMGLMYLENNFQGTINSVECYAEVLIPKRTYLPGPGHCLVHSGTWTSLVHELKNMKAYRRLKMETYPEKIYDLVSEPTKRSFFHRLEGKLWFPYPGPDKDVIEMSQQYLHGKEGKRPYYYNMYTTMPKWYHFLITVPSMFMFYILSCLKCFRHLLKTYPSFFSLGYMSHKGPSEEIARDTKFEMIFKGSGFDQSSSEKSLIIKLSGYDGYKTTCLSSIVAALTTLNDRSKMPKGGVVFVGAAFQNTEILTTIERNKVFTLETLSN